MCHSRDSDTLELLGTLLYSERPNLNTSQGWQSTGTTTLSQKGSVE